MPEISGKTRVLGVVGFPVEHSMSPRMHRAAIEALGLDLCYLPFRVEPNGLEAAVRGLQALNVIGVNLTIPHKLAACALVDSLTDEARMVGAVNTLHFVDGQILGANTDLEGFWRPLEESGFSGRGSKAVVLGAGGAARAVCFKLALEGCEVTIVNRTVERAAKLAADIRSAVANSVVQVAVGVDHAQHAVIGASLLVNTSSVGMIPNEAVSPVPSQWLHAGLTVYDLVYHPPVTRLLANAVSVGARTLDGFGMLVHQGAAAFEIWTGVRPPVDVMRAAIHPHSGA